jgi:TatD DNase family protein
MCTSDTVKRSNEDFARSLPPPPAHSVPYIDTHCHIDYMCETERVPNWAEFLRLHPPPPTCAGVITTLCDTTALQSSLSQLDDLLEHHPNVFFTFGLHPHNSRYWTERLEARLTELIFHPRCVGWGEIGLDVTSEKKGGSSEDEQVQCFLRQLQLASELCPQKAIQIHYRGDGATLEALLGALPRTAKLHLHSWGIDDVPCAQRLLQAFSNLYFGFTSVAQQVRMRQVVQAVPLERLILESDAPYLLPRELMPSKAARVMIPVNHPGTIPFVAATIAEIKSVHIDKVFAAARKNVLALYGLGIVGHGNGGSAAPKRWNVVPRDQFREDDGGAPSTSEPEKAS